jgi:hypothetical protein
LTENKTLVAKGKGGGTKQLSLGTDHGSNFDGKNNTLLLNIGILLRNFILKHSTNLDQFQSIVLALMRIACWLIK